MGSATKAWDDDARAAARPDDARVSGGDAVVAREVGDVSGPRIAESSSTDLPTATLDDEGAEPDVAVEPEQDDDRRMDAMMSGSWAMATRDVAVAMMPPTPAQRDLRESEAEMAALMGADVETPTTESAKTSDAKTSDAKASEATATDAVKPAARAAAKVGEAARPVASVRRPSSVTERPSESVRRPSSVTERPSESVRRPSSVTERPSESVRRPSSVTERPSEPVRRPSSVTERPREAVPRVAVGAVDDDEDDRGRVLPLHAAGTRKRTTTPEPRRITSRTAAIELGEKPKRGSLGWAVVAGVGVAGAVWWFGAANEAASPEVAAARGPAAEAPRAEPTPTPIEPTPASTHVADDDTTPPKDAPPRPGPATPEPKPPVAVPRDADPRTPPPGTPPDVAAVFARLPVSPADLPPVGGVGGSGIHVDRIEMGAGYDKSGCKDVAREFSVSKLEEINVCLRVVHPREEEMMSIVWQKKDGTTARRGKIAVVSLHAYRTRAYLRLRAEYVGDWVVRIMSADGVELAEHAFTIAP